LSLQYGLSFTIQDFPPKKLPVPILQSTSTYSPSSTCVPNGLVPQSHCFHVRNEAIHADADKLPRSYHGIRLHISPVMGLSMTIQSPKECRSQIFKVGQHNAFYGTTGHGFVTNGMHRWKERDKFGVGIDAISIEIYHAMLDGEARSDSFEISIVRNLKTFKHCRVEFFYCKNF